MAYAQVTYPGDGTNKTFTFSFPFLNREHVKCYLDGVETTAFSWITNGSISMTTAPAAGVVLTIKRETPIDVRLVDFSAASALQEEDLDMSALQPLYITQEAKDATESQMILGLDNTFDGRGKIIRDVADPSLDGDVATKHYVDTAATSQVVLAAEQVSLAAGQVALATTEKNAAVAAKDAAVAAKDAAFTYASVTEEYRDEAGNSAALSQQARNASQAAQVASEAARDASEGWKEITQVYADSANVDAVRAETAAATIAGITGVEIDTQNLLIDTYKRAYSGALEGTEGRWKVVAIGSFAATAIYHDNANWGETSTSIQGIGDAVSVNFGSSSYIHEGISITIFGDSGVPYYGVYVNGAGGASARIYLNPKHGDVTSDFTTSSTYTVLVCQESSDAVDQQTGTLDYVEYLVGGGYVSNYTNALPIPTWDGSETSRTSSTPSTFVVGNNRSVQTFSWENPPATPIQYLKITITNTHSITGNFTVTLWDEAHTTGDGDSTGTLGLGESATLILSSDGSWVGADVTINATWADASGDKGFKIDLWEQAPVPNPSAHTTPEMIHAMLAAPTSGGTDWGYNNLSPDPYFEHDGTAGGWGLSAISGSCTIADGVCTMYGASSWGVYILKTFSSELAVEGKQLLVKIVIDSLTDNGTGGSVRAYTWKSNTDGTTEENYTEDFTTVGTHWAIIECDADTTQFALQNSSTNGNTVVVSEFSVFEIPDSSYGTINVGYWNGPTWTSQLLGDLPESSTGIRRAKLGRKASTPSAYYALNVSGAYTDISANCTFTASGNYVDINVGALFATLGYSSSVDMLANSAIKVEYTTIARRLRPAARVNPIAMVERVFFWNLCQSSYAVDMVWELTGEVPTNGTSVGRHSTPIERDGQWMLALTTNTNFAPQHGVCDLGSSCPNAVKLMVELIKSDGTYQLQVYANELVYDSDWGDTGYLLGCDYAMTTTDDNGNVVQYGCYHLDTGVSYE